MRVLNQLVASRTQTLGESNPAYSLDSRYPIVHNLSDRQGLLLEDEKPLERTPHFFEPGVGECVNASGQLAPGVGVEPTLKV